MPIKITQPSGDITADWPTTVPASPSNHWSKIDEGVPGNITDYNQALGAGVTEQYSFPADSDVTWTEVTRVDVVIGVNGVFYTEIPVLEVSLWVGGVQVGTTHKIAVTTAGAWKTFGVVFSGLSLTPAEYDALQVRLATTIGGGVPPDYELSPPL